MTSNVLDKLTTVEIRGMPAEDLNRAIAKFRGYDVSLCGSGIGQGKYALFCPDDRMWHYSMLRVPSHETVGVYHVSPEGAWTWGFRNGLIPDFTGDLNVAWELASEYRNTKIIKDREKPKVVTVVVGTVAEIITSESPRAIARKLAELWVEMKRLEYKRRRAYWRVSP